MALFYINLSLKALDCEGQGRDEFCDKTEHMQTTYDSYGNKTIYFYDQFGRLIKTIYPLVLNHQDQVIQPIEEIFYGDNKIKIQDVNGYWTQISLNEWEQVNEILYPDQSTESFTYSTEGQLQEKKTRKGSIQRCLKHQKRQLTACTIQTINGKVIHQLGNQEEKTINDEKIFPVQSNHHQKEGSIHQALNGSWKKEGVVSEDRPFLNNRKQLVRQTETVDSSGRRLIATYDALHRLESILLFNNLGTKLSEMDVRYDARGNKTLEKHVVLFHGQPIRTYILSWTYDSMNRVTSLVEGLGLPNQKQTSYTYNSLGQLETIVKPDGVQLLYVYDEMEQLVEMKASNLSLDYQFIYDDQQRLIAIHDRLHHHSILRYYNSLNQMIEEQMGSISLKNRYNATGQRVQLTLPNASSIYYRYHGMYLTDIQRLSNDGSLLYQHRYQYSPETNQLLASELIENLGTLHYDYDSKSQFRQLQSSWWSETIDERGMDADQNIVQRTFKDLTGVVSQSLLYTEDQQLRQESEQNRTQQFEYDSLYNCLQKGEESWQINALNQLIQTTQWTYQYDCNGNLIEKKTSDAWFKYEYDALDRLTRVIKNDQLAITYQYDPFYRRLNQNFYHKTDQGHWQKDRIEWFIYDGYQEIGKMDEGGNILELRVLGIGKGAEIGAAIALEINNKIYAPIHDSQGSVRCLIDSEHQTVTEFYQYSAYGEEKIYNRKGELLLPADSLNPWRFASKRKDELTDLIFFGSRYYDTEVGRWITPDLYLFCDTPNPYAFLRNNPLVHCDLYGHFSLRDFGNKILNALLQGFFYLQYNSCHVGEILAKDFMIPEFIQIAIEKETKKFFGEGIVLLMGIQVEESYSGIYGESEISNQIRVTFINGILTTKNTMMENLELISKTHGGVFVHYIFRPTQGWLWDICKAGLVKFGFLLGFRSDNSYALANLWKKLIQDMGGPESGGLIIHYAHSLGGSETDRARDLLTKQEQKMIRVRTFGSATLIADEGFESVVNFISNRDGVVRCFNRYHPHFNLKIHKVINFWPCFPLDHLLGGTTYRLIIEELGGQFLLDFSSTRAE
jgi:RHS repeat-associated protein